MLKAVPMPNAGVVTVRASPTIQGAEAAKGMQTPQFLLNVSSPQSFGTRGPLGAHDSDMGPADERCVIVTSGIWLLSQFHNSTFMWGLGPG